MNLRQLFLRNVSQTSDMPLMLEIEKAEGVYLIDTDGKKYLDLISGISVSNLGHCHPEVVKAVQDQAAKYMHLMVYGEYVYQPQVQLCHLITEQLPKSLDSVYLVNSGTEATEGAMKLAKRVTRRSEFIGFIHSYHGSSQGALSIIGDEYWKRNYRPLLPDTKSIRYNSMEDLDQITERTAAVFTEVVQAESGINPGKKEWLLALRKRCDEVGCMLVFDEIQTGFGRTGKLFAFEHYGVVPDILLIAKGMGGGMPIGAFVSSSENMHVFQDNPILGHITTFGGHPVTAAASLATLKVLLRENYIEEVAAKEKLLRKRLKHPAIQAIRSKGLMMALEFSDFDSTQKVIKKCIEGGLITDWFLFASNCLRIAPPLLITEDELNFACDVILKALSDSKI